MIAWGFAALARRPSGSNRPPGGPATGGQVESETPTQCIQSRKPALERRKNEPPAAAARPPLCPGRGHPGRPCRGLRTLRSHGRGRRKPVGARPGDRADGRPSGCRQGCQGHGRHDHVGREGRRQAGGRRREGRCPDGEGYGAGGQGCRAGRQGCRRRRKRPDGHDRPARHPRRGFRHRKQEAQARRRRPGWARPRIRLLRAVRA